MFQTGHFCYRGNSNYTFCPITIASFRVNAAVVGLHYSGPIEKKANVGLEGPR